MLIYLNNFNRHKILTWKCFISVLVDFCKLTIDYFSNGVNEKKYLIAAGKRHLCSQILLIFLKCIIYDININYCFNYRKAECVCDSYSKSNICTSLFDC